MYDADVECMYCRKMIGKRAGFQEPSQVTSGICFVCYQTRDECSDLRAYHDKHGIKHYSERRG